VLKPRERASTIGHLRGLHGVADALPVERVDHAPGVADEHEATAVGGLAVEGHRQRGALHLADLVLLAEAPLLGGAVRPALQQLAVVGLAEALRRVEHAEAYVAGAVAHAEDPAVAGHQVGLAALAVPELEPALQVVVVGTGARVVRAHRHAHRAVLALVEAHRDRQPR